MLSELLAGEVWGCVCGLLLIETRFNWAARKLHKRLQQLGGREFYPRGEADEQHDEG